MPRSLTGSVFILVINDDLHEIARLRCLLEHAVDWPVHGVAYPDASAVLTALEHCTIPDLIVTDTQGDAARLCLAIRYVLPARGVQVCLVYTGPADARLAAAVVGAPC